ncbi:Superoxide-generating NADPH oxidase heavy chain subunit C [Symbiodinium microadriaticum]|uniref:Superoxide-generating NADPH oxidase heavy chain subunit C n=1 Tax=Symbiodinium microadriaticum TaxID=2951 RepID=A0A1Q9DN00_SYMMI|nr:Superoxide-generating NADPH oxidase heavy chain subunit C [Symbiodinium microadriaticum]
MYSNDQGSFYDVSRLPGKACDGSPFFTSAFVISGAAILVNFLSGVFADVLEEAEEKRRMRGSEAGVLVGTAAPLVLWWLVGLVYGRVHEGWDWGKATLFAISASSSVGIQGLDSKDDISLLTCACYLLVGVPLYASVIARLSILVADDILQRRQQEIKKRAMMALDGCDEECRLDVFSMYDLDQDGFITKDDIPELLKFLSASRGLDIGQSDIDFLLEEFDKDGTGQINQQEFLGGLNQWQNAVKERMSD